MSLSKSMDTYIKIVKKACEITLAQKEWWALAAVAGLVHTGAIFNMLLRTFLHLRPATELDESTLQQVSPFFSWVLSYARNLSLLETPHLVGYIICSLIALAIIAIMALYAQYILLFLISNGTKDVSWKMIRKKLSHVHLLRLFSVNAWLRIFLVLIISTTTLALVYMPMQTDALEILSRIGVYAIALPLAFIVQIIGMLWLIQLGKKESALGKSFHKTINLLHKHWLTALEMALILFIINFLTSGALLIVLMCVAVLSGIAFEMVLSVGSYLLLSIVTFISLLVTVALIFVYAGGITMFNYSAWTKLSDHLDRSVHFPTIEHMLKKIMR